MQGLQFFSCLAITFLTSTLIAQDASTDATANDDPLTVAQVSIKLTEIAVSPNAKDKLRSGNTDAVAKQLAELERQGFAKVIERFQVTALNASKAETQVGAQTPMTTGRSSQRGGGPSKSYTYQEIGTLFSCTPRAVGDHVLLNFLYEKSELVGGNEEDGTPPSMVTTRASSTVRIPKNTSIVIGGQRTGPDNKTIGWNLIIAARVTKS